ncbi:ABC transporter ATP-binding protein [Bacillaceae bacterium]
MIRLHKVSVVLGERTVLRSIDLALKKDEGIALLGPNGAGKSTLLKVLATLIKPTSGKMFFPDGMDLQKWRYAIGTVFPETFLYDALTAMENLNFYRKLYGVTNRDVMERVLERVGLLDVRHEPVRSFSKGMKQRLSIARALIHQPSYMILDEPFDGLDWASQEVLKRLLSDLKAKGTGWVFVTHDPELAWAHCDRVVVLYQGRIVFEEVCENRTFAEFLNRYRRIVLEQERRKQGMVKDRPHAFF